MRKSRNASFKRMICAVLAAMIVATGIPAVFARDYEDVTADHPHRDEIDILSDIGVIVGTSENEFSPDENVTREQMALLLFRLMLNKKNGGRVNTSPFKDLYDDTYHGAISWANASGYILGTSESTFEPLAEAIVKENLAPRIICESDGTMAEDAAYMKKCVLSLAEAGK